MFVWAAIPKSFERSEEFTKALLDEARMMVTPGSAFGPHGEGFVRMSLVQSAENIRRVAENVKASGLF